MIQTATLFARPNPTLVGTGVLPLFPRASLGTLRLFFISSTILCTLSYPLHRVIMTSGVYVTHITPKAYYSDGFYGLSVTVCVVVGEQVQETVVLSINYRLATPDIGVHEDVSRELSVDHTCTHTHTHTTQMYELYPTSQEQCVTTHTQVDPEKIEPEYMWWPRGVKWTDSTPTLCQAIVSINITKKVSLFHYRVLLIDYSNYFSPTPNHCTCLSLSVHLFYRLVLKCSGSQLSPRI